MANRSPLMHGRRVARTSIADDPRQTLLLFTKGTALRFRATANRRMAAKLANGRSNFVQDAPNFAGKPFTLHDDALHRHP